MSMSFTLCLAMQKEWQVRVRASAEWAPLPPLWPEIALLSLKRTRSVPALFSRISFFFVPRSEQFGPLKVAIKNLNGELTKQFPPPNNADEVFYAGTGNVLFKSEEQIVLYDVQQQKVRTLLFFGQCRDGNY